MINKLIEKIQKTNAPIVVGLDPMLNYIPQHIQQKAFSELGETLEGAAEAIWQYNKGIVDAVSDLIPAVKPQIAAPVYMPVRRCFFEVKLKCPSPLCIPCKPCHCAPMRPPVRRSAIPIHAQIQYAPPTDTPSPSHKRNAKPPLLE